MAGRFGFFGASKNFAIGEVAIARTIHPGTAIDIVVQVGASTDDVDVIGRLQAVNDAGLLALL